MNAVPPGTADRHRPILDYYDDRLRRHGDSAQGAGWPNEHDRLVRFQALTEPLRAAGVGPPPLVCDLGCGTGELLRYLRGSGHADIGYVGADRSAQALAHARAKFPDARWIEIDVSTAPESALSELDCDYLVANGLFTVRHRLSPDEMWDFMTDVLQRLWPHVRRAMSFNVMSPVVDWEREDLFHVSHDKMARFLHGLAGRRVQMRADYGLYEYTCVASKPAPAPVTTPERTTQMPAYRPLLPTTDRLAPYLRRIDAHRIYSNHGPLVTELEHRLSAALELAPRSVVTAASGTAALMAAVLASAGRATVERPYALCPSYTFVGTASALQQCGYVPWLVDVDAQSWLLEPEALRSHPRLGQCGVVVPVAANGRPVPVLPWEAFQAAAGIPVVIDGAASIEGLLREPSAMTGSVPVALSFHATKVFPTGEGGAVVTQDVDLALASYKALNFGFLMSRESRGHSFNGKMSEYHAAVGLASLDDWPLRLGALQRVAREYQRAFGVLGLAERLLCQPLTASSYVLFQAPDAVAGQRIMQTLAAAGIETRLWYGRGLHHQPAFVDLPRDELPVTDRLAACLLGLPVAPALSSDDIDRVAGTVQHALQEQPLTPAGP